MKLYSAYSTILKEDCQMQNSKKNIILSICLFVIVVALIISPKTYSQVAMQALDVWAKILLPSLFPFFVFTKLLTSLGYVQNVSRC